eukprot:CAMPEP_0182420366 /NCGR_PEP_ID=MMETSP1167-20130531/5114_1 /TAXON_ID=2988 /ORGANISM="Mallomonas Sp, Strain CCMP3275" /LENGTH=64 /DNA_ID=CAMNT_0024596221 /DNA_START=590 /DNA_END=784 /DNA_ORIENTATION=+
MTDVLSTIPTTLIILHVASTPILSIPTLYLLILISEEEEEEEEESVVVVIVVIVVAEKETVIYV